MRKWHDFINPLHQGLVTLSRWNVSHGVWPSSVILLDLPSFFSSSSSEAKSHELRKNHLTKWTKWLQFHSLAFWHPEVIYLKPKTPHLLPVLGLSSNAVKACFFFFFHLKNEFNSIFGLIGVRALSSTLKRQTDKTMPITILFFPITPFL